MTKPLVTPEEELFVSLIRTAQLARKWAEEELVMFKLTVAEYNLLRIIENSPGISAKEAKERLTMTAASVAQLVRQLEKKQFITRTQSDIDARLQHITLTKEGSKAVIDARIHLHNSFVKVKYDPKLITHLQAFSDNLSVLFPSSL